MKVIVIKDGEGGVVAVEAVWGNEEADTTFDRWATSADEDTSLEEMKSLYSYDEKDVTEEQDVPEQSRMVEHVRVLAARVDGTVRDDYSGRGMRGSRCYGVDCKDRDEAVSQAKELGLEPYNVDNMGLDWIIYWPHIAG